MNKQHDLVDITGYLITETGEHENEGAFLVKTFGNETCKDNIEVWLPKYCTEMSLHDKEPRLRVFTTTEHLAMQKELI